MNGFSTFDVLVVALYLTIIAIIGSSFYRRKSSAKDYFLGGRSIPWLAAGISIIAADMSAITVMGTPAWAYKHNLEMAWLNVGYPLAAPVVLFIFVPFYSKLNLYTAYEYLERRFNLAVRLVVSGLFQILRGWHVAVAIYGPALVINLVTGLPVWECTLFMGSFTTLYTALGGIKAVIWTDVIQFCAVISGILLILVSAVHKVPGGFSATWAAASEAGKLHAVNLSMDPSQLTSIWACLIGGTVLSIAPLTTDQAILQRLFTTKSARDCRQSVILQSVLIVPITLVLYFTGIALFAFYKLNPQRLQGLHNTDAVLPFFAVRELPNGVSGLVIAAIFAASMGVMSAGINSLTTASTVDFYSRVFRPNRDSSHYASVGRLGTAFWGIVTTGVALLAGRMEDLMVAYTRISSFISGPMLGIFLLAATTRRTTSTGALAGAAAGVLAVGTMQWTTNWSFLYQAPAGALMTFIAGYLCSLMTAPPPPEKIKGLVMGQE